MASRREYLNFDLVIEQSRDIYRARVVNSPSGQASVEFKKPFTALELENFVLRMGQSRSGVRRIDTTEMQAAKGLGRHLFTTVFSGEVNSCYLRSVDQVRNQNKGLRVRLRINVPEFNNLPWEFLYDPQFDRFVSLSETTPIIRYLELPYTTRPLPVHAPLKILVMISSPEGYPKLDVQKEWEMLNQALKPLLDRKSVVLEKLEHPTLGALQTMLRQDDVHIFHFIGHGKYFEDKQDGMLLLEDEKGHGRPTSGQYLGTILQDHYPLRLVILNACEGARTSAEDPYAGVAQTLVLQGIPAVLAMQFVIFETAAMTFAKEFYSAIVDNYPVDAALSEARKAIFTSNNDVEWGTPVLFMRTPDGVLFRPESDEERAARLEAEREKQELLKKEAAERLERQKAEKEAREKAEREAAEKAARERAKREASEEAARERAEQEASEKAAREKAESEDVEIIKWAKKIFTKPILYGLGAFILVVIGFIAGNAILGGESPSATTIPTQTTEFDVEMVLIPAGEFLMGSENGDSDEQPIHSVYINAFLMDPYEVTNYMYMRCVEAGNCEKPFVTLNYRDESYANHPVVYVSWSNANAYCEWVDARLPTEAEWEYAARGGLENADYPWGNESPICEEGSYNGASFAGCKDRGTRPVGSYSPNGFGLYDMAGNVWEWVADYYNSDYYENSPMKNPSGPDSSEYRILRGGAWYVNKVSLRVAYRYGALLYREGTTDFNEYVSGFRCVRDANQ